MKHRARSESIRIAQELQKRVSCEKDEDTLLSEAERKVMVAGGGGGKSGCGERQAEATYARYYLFP